LKELIEIPATVMGKKKVELDRLNLDDMQSLIGDYMGSAMEWYFAEWRTGMKRFLEAMAHDLRRMERSFDPAYLESMALHCELKMEKES